MLAPEPDSEFRYLTFKATVPGYVEVVLVGQDATREEEVTSAVTSRLLAERGSALWNIVWPIVEH